MTTVTIEKDPDGIGLYLSINYSLADGVAYAVTDEELPLIRDAINKYLKD